MLTTVYCKFENQQIQFHVQEGDNLWEKVKEFCSTYGLQLYQDKIFNMLYDQFQNFNIAISQSPYKFKAHEHFSENCYQRSLSRNKICKNYQENSYPFSPKITSNYNSDIDHQPFKERINLKQIVHKDHLERHDKIPIINSSPIINKNFNSQNYVPFKERINIKSLNQEKMKGLQEKEKEQLKQEKQITQKRIYYKQREPSESEIDNQLVTLQLGNDQTSFYTLEEKKQKEEYIPLITNIVQLDRLVKLVYQQNQFKTISQESFRVCNEFYRRLITTQGDQNILALKKINLELLEDKEIFFLELLVEKFKLSNNLTFGKTQFLILVLSLTINEEDQQLQNGKKLKDFVQFNAALSANYQQIL